MPVDADNETPEWTQEDESTYRALSRLVGAVSRVVQEAYEQLRAKRQRAYDFHGVESTVPWFHDGIKTWAQVTQDIRLTANDDAYAQYQRVFDDVGSCLREANASVHDVLLAGSLGKGTGVKNLSDIDVVCIFKDFDPTKYHEYLDSIQEVLLKKQLGTLPTRTSLYPGERETVHTLSFATSSEDSSDSGNSSDSGLDDAKPASKSNNTVGARNAHRGAAYLQFEVEGIKVHILPAAQLGQAMGQTFFNGNVAAFSKM